MHDSCGCFRFNDLGSGSVTPIHVAISLTIYFADRIQGSFQGYFMTFSDSPSLIKVEGNNIREKANSVQNADWGGSTNLIKTFQVTLDAAVKNNLP